MRVLQVTKIADGADWAAAQAAEPLDRGVGVEVPRPREERRKVHKWAHGGATAHIASTDLPIRNSWSLPVRMRRFCDLVSSVRPELIHSHVLGPMVLLRLVLGGRHRIPRLILV